MVSDYFPPDYLGGAEISAKRLSDKLLQSGFEVVVCTGFKRKASVCFEEGIKVYRVLRRIKPPLHQFVLFDLWNPAAERALRRVLLEEHPDIVHFHLLHGISFKLIPLAKETLPASRVVTTLHNYWFACVNSKLLNRGRICDGYKDGCRRCYLPLIPGLLLRYKRWCLLHSDAIIAPSEYVKHVAASVGVPEKNIHVIRYGVTPPVTTAPNDSPENTLLIKILFAGRITRYKGIITLLQAYHVVKKTHPNIVLDVVGDGEALGDAKKLATALQLTDVTFHGKQENTSRFYESSDIVVVPSTWPDILPLVPVEAMLHGKPVIATGVGGLPEIVEHNKTGLIVEPGDARGLAEALLKLVGDEKLRRRLGEAGHRKALAEYSWDATLQKTVELYEDLC
jgi:glycosyltransferase involved in cell wall biosynthesis